MKRISKQQRELLDRIEGRFQTLFDANRRQRDAAPGDSWAKPYHSGAAQAWFDAIAIIRQAKKGAI